ncbi:hypothetical protein GX586_13590 [bacterium]|nr:hypothetical protein [bacterium]
MPHRTRMQVFRQHRYSSIAWFALTAAVLALVVGAYTVHGVHAVRQRMEQSLLREGLSIISTFEAFVRAGLKGRGMWDTAQMHELVRDTCYRADLSLFAFIDPQLNIYQVTPTGETARIDTSVTNLMNYLAANQFANGYLRGARGRRLYYVARPLLLDEADRIGRRTFRFYQVLLSRRGQGGVMRRVRPPDGRALRLPVALIGMSADDVDALVRRSIYSSLAMGASIFLLAVTVLYVLAVVQQSRSVRLALAEAQADNERLLRGLRRTDRLAVVGRVMATIAHEIRNPLSSIRGFAQLFKARIAPTDQMMAHYADLVVMEVDRLNTVITRMLDFSKPVEPQFQYCALAHIVNHTLELIRGEAAAHRVSIVSHVSESLPLLKLDRNLITQALLNLIINALDAMPGGGELTIQAGVSPRNTVHLEVRDTGKGIEKEKLKGIFEPFYTTKPSGTGLGLAVVDNIISEHNAAIWVESDVGRGSAFHIEFPLTESDQ